MIKFSWDMGACCNFKCSYCFYTSAGWDVLEKLQGQPRSPDHMNEVWSNIQKKYGPSLIYITGGEPFVYPNFVRIIEDLSKNHYIHITTNLSMPLDNFISSVNPAKVALNATFHPLHSTISEFAEQVRKLAGFAFKCSVCYLAHPGQLREVLNYKRYFAKLGIQMTLTEFWGKHLDKDYPDGYSKEEREFYRYVDQWNTDNAPGKWKPTTEDASKRVFTPERSSGKLCKAGMQYATIAFNGDVKPCGQLNGPFMGNLYDKSVELLKEPIICTARYCKCRETDYL